jgi:2-phospho-L-lactate transferase/gluconeogenesis factor (CofD/UPF0052 family)
MRPHTDGQRDKARVKVVLFTGGRGSTVLSRQLIKNPQIALTLAINGYDDGASTGEVRRFLGDSLGPSDYRKNAARLARELQTCSTGLIDLLDLRLPVGCTADEALHCVRIIDRRPGTTETGIHKSVAALVAEIDESTRRSAAEKLGYFETALSENGGTFSFSDCSLGNLVFAGCFLQSGRNFNEAVADYCWLLNLPDGIIENVTTGTNAFLVALDQEHRIIANEAEIVNGNGRNSILDIYLIARPFTEAELARVAQAGKNEVVEFLEKRSITVTPNPRLIERIAEADLIIYSPGTQYSSLFPSYMTPALGAAIARNLTAIKLLITNIKEDGDTSGSSSVDIINRAVYYLNEKSRKHIPTPFLITHYLINDPSRIDKEQPYIPLGQLERLEDPRLIRIGNYEEGITGRHNAEGILTPFIESFLKKRVQQRVAVCLTDTESLNKISQTILEMLRGGIQELPVKVTVFYHSNESLTREFTESLPFEICNVSTDDLPAETAIQKMLGERSFDYVILFESSGMYKGEDIVNLASLLALGRLDAVWGSRRLSVKDIHQSYKLRYRKNVVLGAISYVGSHLLSLSYLLLYGRYISDTLSTVRAIRASYLRVADLDLKNKAANQHLLSLLLRDRAEIFETPVQFFPLSPEKVRRTTVLDGIESLLTILWWRFKSLNRPRAALEAEGTCRPGKDKDETRTLHSPLNVAASSR